VTVLTGSSPLENAYSDRRHLEMLRMMSEVMSDACGRRCLTSGMIRLEADKGRRSTYIIPTSVP
jgi:hypothetical protein